jgi:quinoprotein glucose dehydrogenase
MGNYVNQPVAALASRIRTSMPLDMPGTLGLKDSADLTAAILAANGYPAGDMEMPSSASALQTITIDPAK